MLSLFTGCLLLVGCGDVVQEVMMYDPTRLPQDFVQQIRIQSSVDNPNKACYISGEFFPNCPIP
jgi:hypothetical protein